MMALNYTMADVWFGKEPSASNFNNVVHNVVDLDDRLVSEAGQSDTQQTALNNAGQLHTDTDEWLTYWEGASAPSTQYEGRWISTAPPDPLPEGFNHWTWWDTAQITPVGITKEADNRTFTITEPGVWNVASTLIVVPMDGSDFYWIMFSGGTGIGRNGGEVIGTTLSVTKRFAAGDQIHLTYFSGGAGSAPSAETLHNLEPTFSAQRIGV